MTDRIESVPQLQAATVLLALIQEDAPAPTWVLDRRGDQLHGQLHGPNADRRNALAAWQRVIGAGPVTTHPSGGMLHLGIRGSYEGVPVEVTTLVPVTCATCEAGDAA